MLSRDAGQQRWVLIIDDEPAIRNILRAALNDVGLTVQVASDGREGLALLRQHPPAVIVVDLTMPHMDGLEFIEACRVLPGFSEVPILLASSEQALLAARPRLQGKGVVTPVYKPFDLDALIADIERLVHGEPSEH